MKDAFAVGLVAGIGAIILWTLSEAWEMTLPVLIGAFLVIVVLVVIFWFRFVNPAIDPILGRH